MDSFCYIVFVLCVCLCHTVLSVSCSLMVTFWKRADRLALLYAIFSCIFDVLGQVRYMIVSIFDICLLPYFYYDKYKY